MTANPLLALAEIVAEMNDELSHSQYAIEVSVESFARWIDQLTALAAAHEGWQPIETAPKDGSSIIGFWINTDENTTCDGRVDFSYMYILWWDGFHWETAGYDHSHEMEPTHWKPCPIAPVIAAATRGGG